MTLRTVIVDDEPLARERVRTLLRPHDDVVVVAECADGPQAVELIEREAPDLVFLDVQMPGLSGFEVLAALPAQRLPAVILVTAFDQYALEAFEIHAVDYLLKPFDEERFRKALSRARETLRQGQDQVARDKLLSLIADLRPPRSERFVVRSGGRIALVRTSDVDYVESAGNYVCLHSAGETHILRETMASLESQLDPARFVRIHRGTIVNLDRVKELEPLFHGEFQVRLTNGTRLVLSRGYRERFEAAIGRSL